MKTLKFLSMLFIASALNFSFVSCGGDDPMPEPKPAPVTPEPTPEPEPPRPTQLTIQTSSQATGETQE